MTLTKLALDDVRHSTDLRAAMDALLAGHTAQSFTPPPEPPEPQPPTEEVDEPGQPTTVVEVVYHHDRRCSTGDLVGGHFVGPMATK